MVVDASWSALHRRRSPTVCRSGRRSHRTARGAVTDGVGDAALADLDPLGPQPLGVLGLVARDEAAGRRDHPPPGVARRRSGPGTARPHGPAPGYPASTATSPYVTTSPGRSPSITPRRLVERAWSIHAGDRSAEATTLSSVLRRGEPYHASHGEHVAGHGRRRRRTRRRHRRARLHDRRGRHRARPHRRARRGPRPASSASSGASRPTNVFEGTQTVRIYNLLAHGALYAAGAGPPRVLPIVEGVLDAGCLVSSLSSIAIDPGETAQPIHADDQLIPLPKPHVADRLQHACGRSPTSPRTTARPASSPARHLADHSPELRRSTTTRSRPRCRRAACSSGTAASGTAAARTAPDERRIGVAMNYCAGWIRQQENQQLGIPLDIARTFCRRLPRALRLRRLPRPHRPHRQAGSGGLAARPGPGRRGRHRRHGVGRHLTRRGRPYSTPAGPAGR